MYKNSIYSFLLISLTIITPYTLTAAAAASHTDPEHKPAGWLQSIGNAATRAAATITKSPLGSLMGHKTPEKAHVFLDSIRIEEKVGDDKIKRNKAERYLNNATAELTENAITSLTATIKQLSIQRDFLTKLLTLQTNNPLSQINMDRLSTINKSLVELESMVTQLKNATPRIHVATKTTAEQDDSNNPLFLTEEQLREQIDPLKKQTTWTQEETNHFYEKLNAYHASFTTARDLRKTLEDEITNQKNALYKQLQARPMITRETAPEISELQKLQHHDYSSHPTLEALNQKIKFLRNQQLAVRLEPWLLVQYSVDTKPNLFPRDDE